MKTSTNKRNPYPVYFRVDKDLKQKIINFLKKNKNLDKTKMLRKAADSFIENYNRDIDKNKK
jgi:hypothetical protein